MITYTDKAICYTLFKLSTRTNFNGLGMSRGERKRGRVNAEGRNEVKGEGKDTAMNAKTKESTQHRYPPERIYHISEGSVRNEMFLE